MEQTRSRPNNLPLQVTSFVGREREVADVLGLLRHGRLLTLTGPGGCGKTRLALEAAAHLAARFEDGVWFTDLAPIEDEDLVPRAVAEALSVREVAMQSVVDTLAEQLRERRFLLVLDNCEHLLEGCAGVANALLSRVPGATILATSRERLRVPGEAARPVPPLSFAEPDDPPSADAMAGFEAVRLFVDRAAGVRPGFTVTDQNAATVADICRRLDGLPLAIELAASRLSALTPGQIAEGLGDRFTLLSGGARTASPRHQALAACMDWSYELLAPSEQKLLRRAAVFAGSFSLEAAREVCSGTGIDRGAVRDLLTALVDRSLITMEEIHGTGRYRLPETIREYAGQKLVRSGEEERVRDRHLHHFLRVAEEIEPKLEGGQFVTWVGHLEAELDNLRSALDRSATASDPDLTLRLAAALQTLWTVRSHLSEGRQRLERALLREGGTALVRAKALVGLAAVELFGADLAAARGSAEEALAIATEQEDARMEGRALTTLGWSAVFIEPRDARPFFARGVQSARAAEDRFALGLALSGLGYVGQLAGDSETARGHLEEALSLARATGGPLLTEISLSWMATAAFYDGDLPEAEARLEEAVAAARASHDVFFLPYPLCFLGLVRAHLGDFAVAEALLEESLAIARRGRNPFQTAVALCYSGFAEDARGNLETARSRLEEGIVFVRALGMRWLLATYLPGLGRVAFHGGDLDEARVHLEEARNLAREAGDRWGIGMSLHGLSVVERRAGEPAAAEHLLHEALGSRGAATPGKVTIVDALEVLGGLAAERKGFADAARFLGAAEALRRSIGYLRFPVDRAAYEADVKAVRNGLGEEEFTARWNEGAALSPPEALEYVSRARGERRRPPVGWSSLTPTEQRVVELVAEGLTNPEIGARMFISKRTVQAHLSHVFSKVGVTSRSELAARATRRGIGSLEAPS